MKRLAVALLLLCAALATPLQAAFPGREIARSPDMANVDMTDTVSWYSEESVRLSIEPWRAGRRVEIPTGATAAWVVCDEGGTNWIVRYDSAPSATNCVFSLAAGEGRLPPDHDYTGYVSLLSGTNILGVLDRHNVAVLGQAADGGSPISPEGGAWGSLLQRMAAVEYGVDGLSHDVATNAAAIAELEDATNALDAADARLDDRIDSLWAECVGGFRWPDYFTVTGVEAGVLPGTVTNAATATQSVYNVVVETVESHTLKGWRIDTEVYRQSDWDAEVRWEATVPPRPIPDSWAFISPDLVEMDGNIVHFAEGVTDGDLPSTNPIVKQVKLFVRGTLGGYGVETALDFDPSKQSATSTVHRFAGPAPGSLLAASWETVLGAASNGVASGKTVHLRTWPEGYGNSTNHPPAGWNTNFWGYGLGDFSCISYHTDWAGVDSGVYRPITMVTPRHGILANHYKPGLGSNTYWVSRSGAILTNRAVAYQHIRGDLAVARLEHAFDTNDIAPAMLLGAGWHSYLYGDTNWLSDLFEVPVVAFDCAERGYVMRWSPPAMRYGKSDKGSHDDDLAGTTVYVDESKDPFAGVVPFYRRKAVGGDSGSPAFWPVDGRTVLLWCFWTPGGGPMPTKEEVDAAIEAWGDEERVEAYNLGEGGWPNPDVPAAPIAGD